MNFLEIMDHFKKVRLNESISSLLYWDMQSLLPKNSVGLREQQLTELSQRTFELETDARFLEATLSAATPSDPLEAKQLRCLQLQLRKKNALDASFIKRMTQQEVRSMKSWEEAKATGNFAIALPNLKSMLALKREKASRYLADSYLSKYFEGRSHYEILMDDYEPGLRSHELRNLLKNLVIETQKRLERILERQPKEGKLLHLPIEQQEKISRAVSQQLGLSPDTSVLAVSSHPFCGGHPLDTRLTSRYKAEDFLDGLMSTIHETGHALYEQGVPEATIFRPGGEPRSTGIHESQSRFYENIIGRSRAFCEYLSPQTPFEVDELHSCLNFVQKSFIRTESDEVTYNLHVALRLEIEEGLIDEFISADELPQVWNAKFQEVFGLTPPSDKLGCLQDVHWYGGLVGYFPTYSIGNLIAAELFVDFEKAHPEWEKLVSKGDFGFINAFMKEKVHRHAGFDDSPEAIKKVLGGRDLGIEAFTNYVDRKYLK